MHQKHRIRLAGAALLVLGAATLACPPGLQAKEATDFTKKAISRQIAGLPLTDRQDMEDATRGFVAPLPNSGLIRNPDGSVAWNTGDYRFLNRDTVPWTVNPSLWRQSRLIMQGGLFKVTDRIYQVRNADLANMTIVEGKTGLIVIDPLTSEAPAKAALELYRANRGQKPVVAVIYSHSHTDHYGGVLGVTTPEEVRAGKVRIIAPEGFMHAVAVENGLAGNAMSRRSLWMYGNLIEPGPEGQVAAGLGLRLSRGGMSLIPPTETIPAPGGTLDLDGITFEFLLTPNTEAPSEMHWYIPELRALSAAENCTHTVHNLYTPRGAKARDPLLWSRYLDETLVRWGDKTDVLYAMHHWPVFGTERVKDTLAAQRDAYRYLNDRTLHLANRGLNKEEIAEGFEFPPAIRKRFDLRGYYGSLENNVKGTYTYYLGWFDGNPLRLRDLPPVAEGRRYVEFMGGQNAVVKKARRSFRQGDYRWTVQVLGHVIAAYPQNQEARELAADAMEQLGYQEENAPRRNFYLTGARELRTNRIQIPDSIPNMPMAAAMTPDMLCDWLAVLLDAEKAGDRKTCIGLELDGAAVPPGEDGKAVLLLGNGVLNHRTGEAAKTAQPTASVRTDPKTLVCVALGLVPWEKAEADGRIKVTGKADDARLVFGCLTPPPASFPLTFPGRYAK